MASPSPERSELHEINDEAACALVDATLGAAEEWRSLIISYRFTSAFQAHWKAEVGHWIRTAQRHGYADRLIARVRDRANHPRRRIPGEVTEADGLYVVLLQELGPAMVAHYFLNTGWTFRAWDVPDGAGGDVDLALTAPNGEYVDMQIKVPGTEAPLTSVEHAARQLSSSTNRTAIVVCSRDPLFVSCEPNTFLDLIGHTLNEWGAVSRTRRGQFGEPEFRHVGGVVLLDYIPGAVQQTYCCTTLLNPWCEPTKTIASEWLPRARALRLAGDRFRWEPEEPDRAFDIPDGTYVPEEFR